MEDGEILDLFFARDEQALTETERKYGAYIGTISLNILRDPVDMEEAKNDILLALWQSIPPHKPENLKAFITTVARRVSLNKHKYKQRHGQNDEVLLSDEELAACLPAHDQIEDGLRVKELSALIDSFLRAQSQTQRKVFLLRHYYYKSIDEIAKRTGFSKSKIKSMLMRTREKLRAYLEKEEIYL